MRRAWGWRFIDELCWTREGVPGRWSNRFANGFEPIYHFSVNDKIKFHPDSVAHETDRTFSYSAGNRKSKTGFVSPTGGMEQHGMALPRNVLKIAADKSQAEDHPAAFPVALSEFFIKAFSDDGDIWYEPFSGSGTSHIAAHRTGRRCYGMEIACRYADVILRRAEAEGLECTLIDSR